jgi:hypothetical protein
MLIDHQIVHDTGNRNGINVAVIQADNREQLETGSTPRDRGGLDHISQIATAHGQGTIVIMSDSLGIEAGDMSRFVELAKQLGVTPPTAAEQHRLTGGASFSMIGSPGGQADSGWLKVSSFPDTDNENGSITGWLQFNPVSSSYNFVTGADVAFDTSAPNPPANGNIISVNGTNYAATLPSGATTGYQVLILDNRTLAKIQNVAVAAGDGATLAATLTSALTPTEPNNPTPLVFLRTIGHPVPNPTLAPAADAIEKLGGTRLAILNLEGKYDYSLAGSSNVPTATAESGGIFGEDAAGALTGILTEDHSLGYIPAAAGPTGGVNTQLATLLYQKPTPWPNIDTAAETYLGHKIGLCGAATPTCDFRVKYSSAYASDWHLYYDDLTTDKKFPSDATGFSEADYTRTREELATEVNWLLRVKNYFTEVRNAFLTSSKDDQVNVKALGDIIYNEVKPPPVDQAAVQTLGLLGKIASVGEALPPPASTAAAGLAAMFGLVAFLANKPGDSSFADQVRARADQLATQIQGRMTAAVDVMTTQARIVVSDYGKLKMAGTYLINGVWVEPQDPKQFATSLGRAVKVWFAESLVPMVHKWLVRATPPPEGPSNARNVECYGGGGRYFTLAGDTPDNAQLHPIQGWNANGVAYRPSIFVAVAQFKPDIAKILFNTPVQGGLGINLYQFLNPRYFGPLRNANTQTTNENCDLVH